MPNNSNVPGLLRLEEPEEDELAISGSTFGMPTPLVSPVPYVCAFRCFCLMLPCRSSKAENASDHPPEIYSHSHSPSTPRNDTESTRTMVELSVRTFSLFIPSIC